MKRNKFLVTLLAATLLPLAACQRKLKNISKNSKGFIAKKNEGRLYGPIRLKGVNSNIINIKVSGKDTNGGLAIFEQTSLSPGRGTPLHVHYFQDEVFHILEGEYYFQVGDDKYRLTEGDSIFLPRSVPHAWTQVAETGKMMVTMQPAGKLENFFLTIAALKTEPSKEEIARIFAENEMEVVGPPLKIN